MAAFSSKGPNTVTPEILKPDITAPGVNVIAAYTEATSPTDESFDTRRISFNTESGTSMSCPHVSGVVGLLKTLHPDWSPSAIRSAIMTTARTRDNTLSPMRDGSFVKATPFSYGAGHMRPNRAMDPGLVYDLTTNDYLDFLCALGYNQTVIELFSDVTLTRTVKNVGKPGTYAAHVREPAGISVSVEPSVLKFESIGEEKSFKVTLKANKADAAKAEDYVFGGLTWSDGEHYVRSPIVVSTAAAS
ncbi:hypothetical protein L1049_009605 [Liquidambar formosana]|uniref:Uncharacterized protein n=1 Tax=Liquidambar formosana TaxID=63359 RepID=A0AAP0N8P9_LIQFO